jgi:hypothetical protein
MAECDIISECTFFNDKMADMPVTAEIMRRKLCRGDFSGCAIFMVAKAVGREYVPSNLIPNQLERVEEIITAVKDEIS